jgi:hypothetical protein
MKRILRLGSCLALAWWLGGCSTLKGDFHQNLQIDVLDAQNRPVSGMQCQVGSGTSAKTVVTPATEVRVHRAMAPVEIECRRDGLVARATVKSRRERMEEALLPFGSVGIFVDHLSGSLYSYPTTLHLRVGQHLVLEHGGEAQVASTEVLPLAAPPPASASASAQRTNLAAAQAAAPAQRTESNAVSAPAKPTTTSAHRAAASAHKPQPALASRSNRAAAKPVKSPTTGTATAAATTKTQTAPSRLAVAAPAAATAAVVVPTAPANW